MYFYNRRHANMKLRVLRFKVYQYIYISKENISFLFFVLIVV